MKLQRFALPNFCNTSGMSAVTGKDILLMLYGDNDELLAIAGQQSLSLSRTADSIDNSSKDTEGGWKGSVAGMKSWSIEVGGLYVASDESMRVLAKKFENSDGVCVVIKNIKTDTLMFGGVAYITDFPLEAPYEDNVTYSVSLSGDGKLVDLATVFVSPSEVEASIPTSGSVTKTCDIIGAKGTVTATSDKTGVTASVSGDVLTISVASTASSGLARITVTDTYGSESDTYEVRVILNSPTV